MSFVLGLVFIIAICGCHFRKDEDGSFIGLKQTSAINGIFVMLVFMVHFSQYITFGKYDSVYRVFSSHLGQLVVVTFLFYSGYGIMYSLMKKENYVSTIPKRFIKLLVHFDLALLLYALCNVVTGTSYPLAIYLQSLIGWRTIGNSTWYIFATLCLYVFVYIAGRISKNRYGLLVAMMCIMTLLFILILDAAGKSDHWFNTIMCFPAGMCFALYYEKNRQLFGKKSLYILNILVPLGICLVCHKLTGHIQNSYIKIFLYELKSIAFVWTIVSVSWTLAVGNPILTWLGGYVFEIYILQRIPMILFQNIGMNKYLYFVVCLVLTLIMAIVFKRFEKSIDKIIDTRLRLSPGKK